MTPKCVQVGLYVYTGILMGLVKNKWIGAHEYSNTTFTFPRDWEYLPTQYIIIYMYSTVLSIPWAWAILEPPGEYLIA